MPPQLTTMLPWVESGLKRVAATRALARPKSVTLGTSPCIITLPGFTS